MVFTNRFYCISNENLYDKCKTNIVLKYQLDKEHTIMFQQQFIGPCAIVEKLY